MQQALELDTNHVDTLYGFGLLYAEQKDFEQAASNLERALLQDETNAHVQYALAINYHNMGEKNRARDHLEMAQKLGMIIDSHIQAQVGR